MISEAQRQGNDCQSWIIRASCWENGTARDVQICHFVQATVLVDDALRWVPMHACGPHVVAVPIIIGRPWAVLAHRRTHSTKASAANFCTEKPKRCRSLAFIIRNEVPIDHHLRHS